MLLYGVFFESFLPVERLATGITLMFFGHTSGDRKVVKVLANPDTGEIFGCHIVGHDASPLIHEVKLV